MKKKKVADSVTVNRKARFDYVLGDELTCGMSLSGLEVRAIRRLADLNEELTGKLKELLGEKAVKVC